VSGLTPEQARVLQALRLKVKAAKGLVRDLSQALAEAERVLNVAEPQEAERDDHQQQAA
jgi:hypothetical protein